VLCVVDPDVVAFIEAGAAGHLPYVGLDLVLGELTLVGGDEFASLVVDAVHHELELVALAALEGLLVLGEQVVGVDNLVSQLDVVLAFVLGRRVHLLGKFLLAAPGVLIQLRDHVGQGNSAAHDENNDEKQCHLDADRCL